MAAATKTTTMTEYEQAVAWQQRSIELAQRSNLQAVRLGYSETTQMFTVSASENVWRTLTLTLYTAGEHANQLRCPCAAQANGMCCGHVGAVLRLLDYERANAAMWLDATAGFDSERL